MSKVAYTRKRVFVDVISAIHSEKRLVKIDTPAGVIPLAVDKVLKGLQIQVSLRVTNLKLGPLLHFGDNFRSNTSRMCMLQQSVNYQLCSLWWKDPFFLYLNDKNKLLPYYMKKVHV